MGNKRKIRSWIIKTLGGTPNWETPPMPIKEIKNIKPVTVTEKLSMDPWGTNYGRLETNHLYTVTKRQIVTNLLQTIAVAGVDELITFETRYDVPSSRTIMTGSIQVIPKEGYYD